MLRTTLIALVVLVAISCDNAGPIETNSKSLTGTWIVEANETEIWVIQDNGIFSRISPLDDHCLQINGTWQADSDHLWTTLQDSTIKRSYQLAGETLSVAIHAEPAKKLTRSDKAPFELMMLAGHCISDGNL